MIATAWRLVHRRAAGDRWTLVAAFLVVLLAATLLAAVPVYGDAVAVAGLRQTLLAAPVAEADVAVLATLAATDRSPVDAAVRAEAAALGPGGAAVTAWTRSASYALPGQAEDEEEPPLTVLQSFEGLESAATLVAGRWPSAGGGGVAEVAVSEAAAGQAGLAAGDQLTLLARASGDADLAVRVTGVFAAPDLRAWAGDPLLADGVQQGGAFTTYGPLLAPPATLEALAAGGRLDGGWWLSPPLRAVAPGPAAGLRTRAEGLEGAVERATGTDVQVDSGLPALLATAQRSLLVTRAGVLVPTVQLVVLAAYALVFVAGVLVGQRRGQTALLEARGSGRGTPAAAALLEGLVLAVPAVLAGPWLAVAGVGVLNRVGPFAAAGLRLAPAAGGTALLLAAVAGAGAVLALTLPVLTAGTGRVRLLPLRAARAGATQRGGVDVLLLAGALLGVLQLRRYDAPLLSGSGSGAGVDPLLVGVPALVLVAGALLALRLVPLVAGLAARGAAGWRGPALPLGVRELARRPLRHAPAALLVAMAVAIGVFAVAASGTWLGSQQDQADFAAGADLRVEEATGAAAPTPAALGAALAGLAGVEAAVPVARVPGSAVTGGRVQVLALDAQRAAAVVALREDLADRPLAELLAPLAAARPAASPVTVPAGERLVVEARLTLLERTPPARLSAVVRDEGGVFTELVLGELAGDAAARRLEAPLPPGRLTLEQLRVQLRMPVQPGELVFGSPGDGLLELVALAADGPQGLQRLPVGRDTAWRTGDAAGGTTAIPPEPRSAEPGEGPLLRFTFALGANLGLTDALATLPLSLAPAPAEAQLPVLATDAFPGGEEVPARLLGAERELVPAGGLRVFPGTDPAAPVAVADLPTLAALAVAEGAPVPEPSEWWVGVADGEEEVAAEGARALGVREVVSRAGAGAALRSDPLALGLVGVLLLGFAAAAAVAVLGAAVSTALSVRERLGEFAVLRALGLSTAELSTALAVERLLSLGLGLAGGTLLGLLLARLVLPATALTQAGTPVVPPAVVRLPAADIALLVLGLAAALTLLTAVQTLRLRGMAPAPLLRAGGEE